MADVNSYAIGTIMCLHILSVSLLFPVEQYIYRSYLQTYPFPENRTHNSTNSSTLSSLFLVSIINDAEVQCTTNKTNPPDAAAQAWAQQKSANLFFWINVWQSVPMIIMTYIIGLYIPKLGAHIVLRLPMVGFAGQIAIWLAIIYFHLAEYWWYVAAAFLGLSGFDGVLSSNTLVHCVIL